MGRLVCGGIMSADGYVADAEGRFDWSMPDAEVHAHVNEGQRRYGTYLYGRRLYEVMSAWETLGTDPDEHDVMAEFGRIWRAADKVVHSRTLQQVTTSRTRLVHDFDVAAVRRLVEESDRDVSVAGPTLAAHAFAAGLVDEVEVYLSPVVVGGGTPFWPSGVRLDLLLVDQHVFGNGVVHVRYDRRR